MEPCDAERRKRPDHGCARVETPSFYCSFRLSDRVLGGYNTLQNPCRISLFRCPLRPPPPPALYSLLRARVPVVFLLFDVFKSSLAFRSTRSRLSRTQSLLRPRVPKNALLIFRSRSSNMDSHAISPSSSSSSPPSVSSSPGDSHDHATSEHVTSPNDTTGGLVASSQDEQAQDETELTSQDATLERHPKGKRKRTAYVEPHARVSNSIGPR